MENAAHLLRTALERNKSLALIQGQEDTRLFTATAQATPANPETNPSSPASESTVPPEAGEDTAESAQSLESLLEAMFGPIVEAVSSLFASIFDLTVIDITCLSWAVDFVSSQTLDSASQDMLSHIQSPPFDDVLRRAYLEALSTRQAQSAARGREWGALRTGEAILDGSAWTNDHRCAAAYFLSTALENSSPEVRPLALCCGVLVVVDDDGVLLVLPGDVSFVQASNERRRQCDVSIRHNSASSVPRGPQLHACFSAVARSRQCEPWPALCVGWRQFAGRYSLAGAICTEHRPIICTRRPRYRGMDPCSPSACVHPHVAVVEVYTKCRCPRNFVSGSHRAKSGQLTLRPGQGQPCASCFPRLGVVWYDCAVCHDCCVCCVVCVGCAASVKPRQVWFSCWVTTWPLCTPTRNVTTILSPNSVGSP